MPPIDRKYISAFIHIIIWICLFAYPFLFHYVPFTDLWAVLRITFFLLFLLLFFYTNSLILIPKLLSRKKVLLYLLSIIVFIILISFATGYTQIFFNPAYKPELFDRSFNTGVITSILTWLISSGIKVTTEWFRHQQLMKSIENEKLNTELNFLKSQVNPHFLFNSLNNIYSLENKRSPDTSTAILRLSDLVRYMLYETSPEFVSLEKEINYLKNYIELQRLSLSKEVKVDFVISGDYSFKKIEPMLLIPLVENVFKHGLSYLNNSGVFISINISGSELDLITKNSLFESNSATDQKKTGIGLSNLRKRLNLLYPGKHSLIITKNEGLFITHLKIRLK
jgi:two-component system, LytTR family, sensor kinase